MREPIEINDYTPLNFKTYRINAFTKYTNQFNLEIRTTDKLEAELKYKDLKNDIRSYIKRYIDEDDYIKMNLREYEYIFSEPYNKTIETTIYNDEI